MTSKRQAAAHLKEIKRKVIEATTLALTNASDDIQSGLRDVVRDWSHKVDFDDTIVVTKFRTELTIKPKGRNVKIFGYVDKGTKGPYIITAKNAPRLKFQTGYSARTAPTAKYNQGTGKSFGSWASPKTVIHPGIKPRKFIETFTDDLVPSLKDRIDSEVRKALAS